MFGEGIKVVVQKVDSMREEYQIMSANFKNLEKAYDRFVERTENTIDKIQKDNEDLRRRIIELEAIVNATLKISMKEAVQSAIKDHLRETGNTQGLNQEGIIKYISNDGKTQNQPNDIV